MKNSEKYEYIECRLNELVVGSEVDSLRPAMIIDIIRELMAMSKSTENPDNLPVEIRDTYHRLYG